MHALVAHIENEFNIADNESSTQSSSASVENSCLNITDTYEDTSFNIAGKRLRVEGVHQVGSEEPRIKEKCVDVL